MALVGINNENEFYSNHYLGEVFTSDIRDVLEPGLSRKMPLAKLNALPVNRAKRLRRATARRGTSLTAWRQSFSANSLSMKNSARSRSVLPISALAGSRC